MIQYFDEVAQKIDKGTLIIIYLGLKWGSVLVHCGAGVSRVVLFLFSQQL